jgi:hypothetical protein
MIRATLCFLLACALWAGVGVAFLTGQPGWALAAVAAYFAALPVLRAPRAG